MTEVALGSWVCGSIEDT